MYSISRMKAHLRKGVSLRSLKLRYQSPEHPCFLCHVVYSFSIPIAKLPKDQEEYRERMSTRRTRSPSPCKRIETPVQDEICFSLLL